MKLRGILQGVIRSTRETEILVDYHHGMDDARKKTLRMMGDPVQRYREEAQRLEDKREQRLLDELSQRLPRHDPY